MKQELTQVKLKELLHYNPETGIFTYLIKVKGHDVGDRAGVVTARGYLYISLLNTSYRGGRLACLYMTGSFPEVVDHINNIKDDDRWCNLRTCTQALNNINASLRKNNTSGIKGVSWNTRSGKWVVQLQMNKKKLHFGYYEELELAELVVQEAREKLHGEFANHG